MGMQAGGDQIMQLYKLHLGLSQVRWSNAWWIWIVGLIKEPLRFKLLLCLISSHTHPLPAHQHCVPQVSVSLHTGRWLLAREGQAESPIGWCCATAHRYQSQM